MKSLRMFRPTQMIMAAVLSIVLLAAGVVAVSNLTGSTTFENVAKKNKKCSQDKGKNGKRGNDKSERDSWTDKGNGAAEAMFGLPGWLNFGDEDEQTAEKRKHKDKKDKKDKKKKHKKDKKKHKKCKKNGKDKGNKGKDKGNKGNNGKNGTSSGNGGMDATEMKVLAIVNDERSKNGCGPLKANAKLAQAAQNHSDYMDRVGQMEHEGIGDGDPGSRIEATGYKWSTYGENIAMGQTSPEQVMNDWMHSPGHRANILNCEFKELGVGLNSNFWTQNFGTS